MFMVAGGHFAGLVARVSKPSDEEAGMSQKGKQRRPIPDVEITLHKTFHRYTSRYICITPSRCTDQFIKLGRSREDRSL